ncbi:MAG: phosphotransferase family protein [Hyphomicrobiaceae bacterium]
MLPAAANQAPPSDVLAALRRLHLIDAAEQPALIPLSGGVSSDIWRVDAARGIWCIKRALAKLKVQQDWRAPVSRSRNEYDWIATAGRIVPQAAPELAGYDAEAGLIVMRFYDPAHYPLWKAELAAGRADPRMAAAVGDTIGRIHAGTAGDPAIAARFATDDIFHAIRLDPYLGATAQAHPELATRLEHLAAATAATKRALVHGDVSPKNILLGPEGPMFLDAECAWYGDPAFDLAFCLNHMLLKCLWVPDAASRYLASFAALVGAYRDRVVWEPVADLERRTAHLLPGLFLARVDGKSPVEYIKADTDKDRVRRVATRLLRQPVDRLASVAAAWREEIGA